MRKCKRRRGFTTLTVRHAAHAASAPRTVPSSAVSDDRLVAGFTAGQRTPAPAPAPAFALASAPAFALPSLLSPLLSPLSPLRLLLPLACFLRLVAIAAVRGAGGVPACALPLLVSYFLCVNEVPVRLRYLASPRSPMGARQECDHRSCGFTATERGSHAADVQARRPRAGKALELATIRQQKTPLPASAGPAEFDRMLSL